MPITIFRHGDDRYQVAVSPPHGEYWRSPSPMTAWDVFAKLPRLGCHSTDVADALEAADPRWAEAYDKEVAARREADGGPG